MYLIIVKILLVAFAVYLVLVEIILTSMITEHFEEENRLFVEGVIACFSLFIGLKAPP